MLIVFVLLGSKLVYYKCNFCENIHNSYFSGFRHAAQPNIYQPDKIFVDTYIFCCQMAEILVTSFHVWKVSWKNFQPVSIYQMGA